MPLIGSPWHSPDWGDITQAIRRASRAAFGAPDDPESFIGALLAGRDAADAGECWFDGVMNDLKARLDEAYEREHGDDAVEAIAKAAAFMQELRSACGKQLKARLNAAAKGVKGASKPPDEVLLHRLRRDLGSEIVRLVQDSRRILGAAAMSHHWGESIAPTLVDKLRIIDELSHDLDYAFANFEREPSQAHLLAELFNLPEATLVAHPVAVSRHYNATHADAIDPTARMEALMLLDVLRSAGRVETRSQSNARRSRARVAEAQKAFEAGLPVDEDAEVAVEEDIEESALPPEHRSRLEHHDIRNVATLRGYLPYLAENAPPVSLDGNLDDDGDWQSMDVEDPNAGIELLGDDYGEQVIDLTMEIFRRTQWHEPVPEDAVANIRAARRHGLSDDDRLDHEDPFAMFAFSPPRIHPDKITDEQRKVFGGFAERLSPVELERLQEEAMDTVTRRVPGGRGNAPSGSPEDVAIRLGMDKLLIEQDMEAAIARGVPEALARAAAADAEKQWVESLSTDELEMLGPWRDPALRTQGHKLRHRIALGWLVELSGIDPDASTPTRMKRFRALVREAQELRQKAIANAATQMAGRYLELFGAAPAAEDA